MALRAHMLSISAILISEDYATIRCNTELDSVGLHKVLFRHPRKLMCEFTMEIKHHYDCALTRVLRFN